MNQEEVVEKCLANLRNAGLDIQVSEEKKPVEDLKCQRELPEAVPLLKCFEKAGHKGIHAYSGIFKCSDGTELVITAAWGKKKQADEEA